MPPLSRVFIHTALIYLLLGITAGGLLLANKGLAFAPALWALLPAHIEFLIMGWLTQLAMGVAFWILPRLGNTPAPRGDERLSWAAYALINLGIVFYILVPFLKTEWLALAARILQSVGLLAFAAGNWPRIYPPKWQA